MKTKNLQHNPLDERRTKRNLSPSIMTNSTPFSRICLKSTTQKGANNGQRQYRSLAAKPECE